MKGPALLALLGVFLSAPAFGAVDLDGSIAVTVEGSRVDFVLTITNKGDEPSDLLMAGFFRQLDRTPKSTDVADAVIELNNGLGAGKSHVEALYFQNVPPGTYQAWMMVLDPLDPTPGESDLPFALIGPETYMVEPDDPPPDE